MDVCNMIVLVKWDPDDLVYEVVSESDFTHAITADTSSFYPHIKRSMWVMDGERINGYKWFNTHIDALAEDKGRSVANFLTEAANAFSGYNFAEGEEYSEHDQAPVYCFMAAGTLHPTLLRGVKMNGFGVEYPFGAHGQENSVSDFLIASSHQKSETIHAEANSSSTEPRPLWLL